MFDLDVLEAAINHIGRTDLRTTVLGKLYLSKGNISSGSEISTLKYNIEQAQARIDEYTDRLNKAKSDKEEKHQLIAQNPKQNMRQEEKSFVLKEIYSLRTQKHSKVTSVKRLWICIRFFFFPRLLRMPNVKFI